MIMSHSEHLARQLYAEAEQKKSPKGFLRFFFNSSNVEGAIDCYQRAANLFKLSKNWTDAAKSYLAAAKLFETNNFEAANMYVLASKCFDKFDIEQAVECLLKAKDIYVNLGKIVSAAKLFQNVAEIYEKNGNFRKAIHFYNEAVNHFVIEDNHWQAKKCMTKIAEYSATELEDYSAAATTYEQLGGLELKNSMTQYGAKDAFTRALLCYLMYDLVAAKSAIVMYQTYFPGYENCKEFAYIEKIITSIDQENNEELNEIIKQFVDKSYLTPWHLKILDKLKAQYSSDKVNLL